MYFFWSFPLNGNVVFFLFTINHFLPPNSECVTRSLLCTFFLRLWTYSISIVYAIVGYTLCDEKRDGWVKTHPSQNM